MSLAKVLRIATAIVPIPGIVFLSLVVSCQSQPAQTRYSDDSLVVAKVGENPSVMMNASKEYVLLQSRDTLAQDTLSKYIVIRENNKEIVLEGSFTPGGYVKWAGDTMVEVFSIPRHITTIPDSSMYVRQILLER